MSLKRPSDDSSPHRSSKRRHISFPAFQSTPVTPARTNRSHVSFPSSSSTPYPPCPSDSPSNPFGRTRTLSASLPSKTAFGQHLPLRFQFFRHGTKRDKDGVYRIVQVPKTYTFKHLKSLIAFLYGGQAGMAEAEDEDNGHLFEIRKNVQMYSKNYKPGTIRRSDTAVRLSSTRDPYRYKAEWDYGENWREAEEDEEDEEVDQLHDQEEESRWEAEEDYTLGHVWRDRPDAQKAIVYYHSSAVDAEHPAQVQITLDTFSKLPRRKGHGNAPYVFEARGHVYVAPLVEEDYTTGDFAEEDFAMDIDPDTWNKPDNAFATYLVDTIVIPPPDFQKSRSREPSLSSTPGLTQDSSSPLRLADLLPCTPHTSSPLRKSLAKSRPTTFPKYTPAPPAAQRKRIAYIQGRIERSRHKTKSLHDSDEEKQAKAKAEPAGVKHSDGRILSNQEALRIISADDDEPEV